MKFLFSAYCFKVQDGPSFIGVYKRCLRIGVELHKRGHEVVLMCPVDIQYQDALTEYAASRIRTVEFPEVNRDSEDWNEQIRWAGLQVMERENPDIFIVGEAPLTGTLLESTLCAAELKIPVIILDNAYGDLFAEDFYCAHGLMADGLILTGLSSLHDSSPSEFVCQVPPYIQIDSHFVTAAKQEALHFRNWKVITVMAYDHKAAQLGINLLRAMPGRDVRFCFVTGNPQECQKWLSVLPRELQTKVHLMQFPNDAQLFGLLKVSDLAIVKYGFMQTSECLALHTPVVAITHYEDRWLDFLPKSCQLFIHLTESTEIDAQTKLQIERFLNLDSNEMNDVHQGAIDGVAVSKAASFLEKFEHRKRRDMTKHINNIGFTEERILKALYQLHPGQAIELQELRCNRIRSLPECQIYALICFYRIRGFAMRTRLWGRQYNSELSTKLDLDAAEELPRTRWPLHYSTRDLFILERHVGEFTIPKCPGS